MSITPPEGTSQEAKSRGSEIRFAFGKNWQRFLQCLGDERIAEAEKSLRLMLEAENLHGKSFLDIGCGSGLFSLAAMRLGAAQVHSFDYDLQSVACTRELKQRYFQNASTWTIEQGSVLDETYLPSLGTFDFVYSWGVLHHTGNMWRALENVVGLVETEGKLFIALYNDEDIYSRFWRRVKRSYSSSAIWRVPILAAFGSVLILRGLLKDVFFLRKNPLTRYTQYKKSRGMSYFTDLIDWLGGYPYEVANPGEVFDFFRKKGFELVRLKTVGRGNGCNEFVFRRRLPLSAPRS